MSNLLEADSSILEQNLKFVKHDYEDELNSLFSGEGSKPQLEKAPYKLVQPVPGFCIKAFKCNDQGKFFINICQTDGIPAPDDIMDAQLQEILQSETPSSYRIPMSIGEPRPTRDVSGNDCLVSEIAINTKFFNKIESSVLFREFFFALIFEALENKHNIQLMENNWMILKNRKAIGTIGTHRIANRDVEQVVASQKDQPIVGQPTKGNGNKLIQEITDDDMASLMKAQTNTKNSAKKNEVTPRKPECRLYVEPKEGVPVLFYGEFHLPDCNSFDEIELDVGEDRIQLESRKRGYILDAFLPYNLNQTLCRSYFNVNSKMLSVTAPILKD